MRVAHVITRLIIGGAQENTVLNCKDLRERYGDDVLLITGPALGPEGSLMSQAVANEIPLHCVDSLRRPIHPCAIWSLIAKSGACCEISNPMWFTRIAQRGVFWAATPHGH